MSSLPSLSSLPVFEHLRPTDYKVVPWKNGGGTTTELAVEPRDGTVATGFTWRLSLATLNGPGPFSPFPGIDRIIMQLDGKPMLLDHGDNGQQQLALRVPYAFAGEWSTFGHVEGTAHDLNFMVNRQRATADAQVVRLDAGGYLSVPASVRANPDDRVVVHVLDGQLRLMDQQLANPGDTLLQRYDAAAPNAALTIGRAQQAAAIFMVMVRIKNREPVR